MSDATLARPRAVTLDGGALAPGAVRAIARDFAEVAIEPAALARMAEGAEVLERAVGSGVAVYGLTTGLGARVGEAVPEPDPQYALRTIRGRATAVGAPLSRELTRATMAVRAAGLCAGGSGASPGVALGLADLLNHRVHPRVPRSGSIGASDLCLMAHVGLGLVGEGRAELDGEELEGAQALARAGLAPLALAPRDGLAICSSAAVSVAAATLALLDARACLDAAQVSAALSLEGFRANLGPLDPRVVAARPAPGQAWSAAGLRELLAGGVLPEADPPRRLQDPLSFRGVAPSHGALHTALGWLEAALAPELAGAADSPLVLGSGDASGGGTAAAAVISTGNFQVPGLALAFDAVALGLAQVAHGIAERVARLTEPRISGLPANLVDPALPDAVTHSGVGPVVKTAHALVLEIRHAAAPVCIHPARGADGVEDDSSGATQAALRVADQLDRLGMLVALELLVAAEAVDLGGERRLGAGTAAAHAAVRELIPRLGEDRPLGPEIERLARELVVGGELVVGARLGRGAG